MKVGTDAVLLGSWMKVNNAKSILDIGTGSGLIAMMLAQRTNAQIDAIEIDKASVEQAAENITEAGWANRIVLSHISLQDYITVCKKKYDLIVSNPPFFLNSLAPPSIKKRLAKHGETLPPEILLKSVLLLMKEDGTFWLILPAKEGLAFREMAVNYGLYCKSVLNIYAKEGKTVSRIIQCFGRNKTVEFTNEDLTILDENNTYTMEYQILTKDYYLDF